MEVTFGTPLTARSSPPGGDPSGPWGAWAREQPGLAGPECPAASGSLQPSQAAPPQQALQAHPSWAPQCKAQLTPMQPHACLTDADHKAGSCLQRGITWRVSIHQLLPQCQRPAPQVRSGVANNNVMEDQVTSLMQYPPLRVRRLEPDVGRVPADSRVALEPLSFTARVEDSSNSAVCCTEATPLF